MGIQIPDPWYRPRSEMQSHLFGESVEDVLDSIHVSRDDLQGWAENGWISFDVDRQDELQMPFVWEIEFVRSVATSGLTNAQISEFLQSLDKPYRFNPKFVAYHFTYGWVCPKRHDPDDVVEQHLDEWLDSLAESEDFDRLEQLQDRIAVLLEDRPDESPSKRELPSLSEARESQEEMTPVTHRAENVVDDLMPNPSTSQQKLETAFWRSETLLKRLIELTNRTVRENRWWRILRRFPFAEVAQQADAIEEEIRSFKDWIDHEIIAAIPDHTTNGPDVRAAHALFDWVVAVHTAAALMSKKQRVFRDASQGVIELTLKDTLRLSAEYDRAQANYYQLGEKLQVAVERLREHQEHGR